MNLQQRKEYLQTAFMKALGAGLCKTQKEWAELLEIDRAGLSSAMNGNEKACTESLVRKVRLWVQAQGLEDGPQPAKPQAQDIVIPAATAELYNNLSETVRIQAETISRLQDQLLSKKPESVEVCRKLGIA